MCVSREGVIVRLDPEETLAGGRAAETVLDRVVKRVEVEGMGGVLAPCAISTTFTTFTMCTRPPTLLCYSSLLLFPVGPTLTRSVLSA